MRYMKDTDIVANEFNRSIDNAIGNHEVHAVNALVDAAITVSFGLKAAHPRFDLAGFQLRAIPQGTREWLAEQGVHYTVKR